MIYLYALKDMKRYLMSDSWYLFIFWHDREYATISCDIIEKAISKSYFFENCGNRNGKRFPFSCSDVQLLRVWTPNLTLIGVKDENIMEETMQDCYRKACKLSRWLSRYSRAQVSCVRYYIVRVCTDSGCQQRKTRRDDICSVDNSLFEILHLWTLWWIILLEWMASTAAHCGANTSRDLSVHDFSGCTRFTPWHI